MTFLELCADLHLEAGISGIPPNSVINQAGENKRIVNWIKNAWHEIQLNRKDWLFLRGTYSFNTNINDGKYSASDAGISTRFREFDKNSVKLFQESIGVNDEYEINYIPYEQYRSIYLTGTQVPSRPLYYSIDTDMALLLGYKPNAIYTVSGEYYKTPQILAANDEVPDMPIEYHRVIVYKALEAYALFEAAPEVLSRAMKGFNAIYNRLENNQLPDLTFTGSEV